MAMLDNSPSVVPLMQLMGGEAALVKSVVGNTGLVCRLAELGLCSGAAVEMVRPGVTCILRVNGSKLCVRGDELLRVLVSPLPVAMRHSA